MTIPVTYIRYYFPIGLRWTMTVLLAPLIIYLIIIGWFITTLICLLTILSLWTFRYVTSVDINKKIINDAFLRFGIPVGNNYSFYKLNHLQVKRENQKYKANTRSREYWVHFTEYTLYINYDENKELALFTINDADIFKSHVQKFAQQLNLSVEST